VNCSAFSDTVAWARGPPALCSLFIGLPVHRVNRVTPIAQVSCCASATTSAPSGASSCGAYFSHDLPIHTVDGMIWSPDGESYASLSFQCLAFTDKSVLRLDVAICGGAYFSPDLPIRAVDGMIWSLDGECLDVVIVPPPPRLPKPLSE